MNSTVKSVTLIFENVETCTIPISCIGYILIDDVSERISSCCGVAKLEKSCGTFVIEVHRDAQMSFDFHDKPEEPLTACEVFKRINRFNDITDIIVAFTDGSGTDYTIVPNLLSNEEENIDQESMISANGNLYIKICKDLALSDFFNIDEINCVEYQMHLHSDREQIKFCNDSLPEFYRFVTMCTHEPPQATIAMRVPDKETGWKFIYPSNDSPRIPIPDEYSYIDNETATHMGLFKNKIRSIEQVVEDYPR